MRICDVDIILARSEVIGNDIDNFISGVGVIFGNVPMDPLK